MFSFSSIDAYHEFLGITPDGCSQAVAYYLERIATCSNLNAFVELFDKECLERARVLDEKRKSGQPLKALHGVVIAIKDVICYKDHPVSAASKSLEGFISIYNSTVVQRMLDEDAIIIGSCNCDEFAMGSTNENSVYGPVLNALDTTKVPGGSSGGSAVAVQAGLCMVSLGSDTGGSVRQPADFCGIIGLKPSYGCISRYGLIAYASSFDQVGIFANTINDVSLVLSVISGNDDFDSTADAQVFKHSELNSDDNKPYKIAILKNALDHPSLDPEIRKAILGLADNLTDAGHTITFIDLDLLDYIVPAYYVLTTAEASSNLSRYDGIRFGTRAKNTSQDLTKFYTANRTAGFGIEVKRRIMLGTFVLSSGYYEAYYSKAQKIRRMLVDSTARLFNEFDAILLPTVPTTAYALGEMTKDPVQMYLADIFTVFANLTGLPAISIPLFRHSNNLPFGLQIMTNRSNELTLLRLSGLLLECFKQVL